VSTLGSAQAGMTAGASDVTTMIFNPAAIGFGMRTEGAIGVTGLSTNVKFEPSSATTVLGTPIPGDSGGNAGTRIAVPNLYLATDASDGVRVGVAIAPRFGLGSYWSSQFVGRYYAIKSELTTVDFVPTLSYRATEAAMLGLGIDVEYATATTTSAIDFGTLDQVLTSGAFGGVPGASDGFTESKAHSWGIGVAAGLLYQLTPATRVGISYHSRIHQRLSGSASFNLGGPVGQGVAAASGAFQATKVNSDLDMPSMASVGVYHELDSRWAVMADAKWTNWQTLNSLQVNFANPLQPPVQTQYSWRNSWFLALGGRYRFDERTALRLGVAYDQSPTKDETRNPTVPDSSSYWAAAGLEYRISPALKLDFAYGHIFTRNAPVRLRATGDNAFRGNLSGNITDSSVDYLGLQAAYRF
jgi:long-chain fatty acid transport protein